MGIISRYYHWLHGKWPAGSVEKLPVVGENGQTNVPGIRIVGDLSGVPLLKFSSETGTQAVRAILAEPDFAQQRGKDERVLDVAIIGGGVSGVSAAMEAAKAGLRYELFEATQLFSTVANFPKAKPIFTYPTELTPAGGIQYSEASGVKESLLEDMERQRKAAGVEPVAARIERIERTGGAFTLHHGDDAKTKTRALRVIVAIGRSGNFRRMDLPGEELDKVSNRLHDPKDFAGKDVLVVGGGDSAAEAAIALVACGARVTFSYRGEELTRPKPENIEKLKMLAENPGAAVSVAQPTSERVTTAASSEMRGKGAPGRLTLALGTAPVRIEVDKAILRRGKSGPEETIPNDYVFAMIGREAPLEFFRRSGITINGDRNRKWWITFALTLIAFIWLYHWKKDFFVGTPIDFNPSAVVSSDSTDTTSLFATLRDSAKYRSFWYSSIYAIVVIIFGIRRVQRRKTPYVKLQTLSLVLIAVIPLYLLPEIILPWMGHNGLFAEGAPLRGFADTFFEVADWKIAKLPEADRAAAMVFGAERSYWRVIGFILAWPLVVANWFTEKPMWGWLIVGSIQTFVLIPLLVWRFGKGAYCGWICSCGALAETLGDTHRHKMPHGPKATRWNMVGQFFLAFAVVLMFLRIVSWTFPGSPAGSIFHFLEKGAPLGGGLPLFNYEYFVDLLWSGIIGVGFYFHLSGRVWCRFACPLAALMNIYGRFSRFRIFAEKKKCISCNVCTSVCHQGIDIMNFANKGMPMEDPECVRCSACVQQCPTGVLSFGHLGEGGVPVLDRLGASPVRMREKTKA
ncbi:MAG: NAD(P)-binding domain-containing protein [Chthoniobacteraceae bacterium]